MNVIGTLTQLRAGQRPASGLLHSCRLHAFGSEAYGEEAIVERFRVQPCVLSDPIVIEVQGHLALFAGVEAMVADLAGGNLARLWRVGPGDAVLPEPGVSVVFDPDCTQLRGDVLIVTSDHPALASDAVVRVQTIGRELALSDPAYRARAFAIRAFGSAAEGAALFALYRLAGNEERSSGFVHVAVRWADKEVVIVRDSAGEAAIAATPWTPHVPR